MIFKAILLTLMMVWFIDDDDDDEDSTLFLNADIFSLSENPFLYVNTSNN